MINQVAETFSDKTTSQYKIIEDKYEILKTYLNNFFDRHSLMSKEDVELIINSLELIKMKTEVEKKEEVISIND